MRLDEAIDIIEGCNSLEELRSKFHEVVQHYGFASFAFVDVGSPGIDNPLVIATTDKAWDDEYRSNGFVHMDPVLSVVRRTNTPFTWRDVPLPIRKGKRKPGALKTMDAARDHGLTEGLVVSFHFVDKIGRINSASCVFFWKDRLSNVLRLPRLYKSDLHLLMIYWAQRVIELSARDQGRRTRFDREADQERLQSLTDRERVVLEWAARGKTMAETASILSISDETVETHLRSAMRKLDAVNKTQAAVKAIQLGLIDV